MVLRNFGGANQPVETEAARTHLARSYFIHDQGSKKQVHLGSIREPSQARRDKLSVHNHPLLSMRRLGETTGVEAGMDSLFSTGGVDPPAL